MNLQDIVKITRGYQDPPSSIMHFNGENCIGLAISMRDGGNIIKLGDNINLLLDELKSNYPIGVEFDNYYFQPKEVQRSVDDFVNNILQAIVIVMIVMM